MRVLPLLAAALAAERISCSCLGQRWRAHGSYSTGTHGHHTTPGVARDSHGHIARSAHAQEEFRRAHACPPTGKKYSACPGWVVDHVQALKLVCGRPFQHAVADHCAGESKGPYRMIRSRGATMFITFVRRAFAALSALTLTICVCANCNAQSLGTAFSDLWWNPAESGWGVTVDHQQDAMFLTFFNIQKRWLAVLGYSVATASR